MSLAVALVLAVQPVSTAFVRAVAPSASFAVLALVPARILKFVAEVSPDEMKLSDTLA